MGRSKWSNLESNLEWSKTKGYRSRRESEAAIRNKVAPLGKQYKPSHHKTPARNMTTSPREAEGNVVICC